MTGKLASFGAEWFAAASWPLFPFALIQWAAPDGQDDRTPCCAAPTLAVADGLRDCTRCGCRYQRPLTADEWLELAIDARADYLMPKAN